MNKVLVCSVLLETGETVDTEKGNRLIEEIVGCLKGKGISAVYAHFILDAAKKEVTKLARLE